MHTRPYIAYAGSSTPACQVALVRNMGIAECGYLKRNHESDQRLEAAVCLERGQEEVVCKYRGKTRPLNTLRVGAIATLDIIHKKLLDSELY